MIRGKVIEYRLAIFGLEGSGKTSLIKKICFDQLAVEGTADEPYQDTAIFDNYFIYFWDYPQKYINGDNGDDEIVGFGGIIYMVDISNMSKFEESRLYIEDLMRSKSINDLPLLILLNKIDAVQEQSLVKPTKLMNELLINLKKSQCILFSAKEGTGIGELQQWILNTARSSYTSEIRNGQASSNLLSQSHLPTK